MNVQKTGLNPQQSFGAKTTIIAPEKLISKQQQEYLINLGKKVGKESDILNFSVSDLHSAANNPNVKTYTIMKQSSIDSAAGSTISQSSKEVPYEKNGVVMEKNSPFNYIKLLIERLMK